MNLPDPEAKLLHDLDMFLYYYLWDGKQGKFKRSGVQECCQCYICYQLEIGSGACQPCEAGGLKTLDVKSYLSALKISWLKCILCDDGLVS